MIIIITTKGENNQMKASLVAINKDIIDIKKVVLKPSR